ncbi:uncharacterized protein LOC142224372 isoform X2 [Haematobia irritans]|uniref:uncharacterized protein LOC142224372 isoform X2 n=1 Tax=Haematobia irritans TaxID=7368 RepID=UPI003F4FB986
MRHWSRQSPSLNTEKFATSSKMMITKSDVIMWFRALESYKRIDTMCTLLNLCLPFELRFLGTCLEELGRRDSQELRGMELRANNPQDLAQDMVACQKGEPTDMKVRRKMALYLALIRACNRTNVTEIFRTLESWGELDFSTMSDIDTLKELLLVYTMAANHPVFEFDQHLKCMRIFEKIKENKLVADPPPSQTPPPTQTHHQTTMENQTLPMTPQHQQQQMHQHPAPPPSQQEMMQQHTLHPAMFASGQHHQLLAQTPMQMLPQGIPLSYPQSHLAKLIPSADGTTLQHQITTVENLQHLISSNIIPDTSNAAILAHPNPASWAMRQYHPPPPPQTTGAQNLVEHPPQASSPMLSQQSSPSSSRATSPNRTSSCDSVGIMQGQHQTSQNPTQTRNMSQRLAGSSLKNIRRPSAETTPPPMTQMEMIIPPNMKHIQEVVMNNEGTGNQLQNLIRNGFTRSGNHQRVKANTYVPPHQQQQQQSPVNQHYQGNFPVNAGLTYAMQNMTMADMSSSGHHSMDANMLNMNSNKSAGSDSGSSMGSSGEISPPETPTLMMNNATTNPAMRVGSDSQQSQQQQQQQQPTQKHHQPSQLSYNKQMGLQRLNGRSEKMASSGGSGGGSGNNVMNTSSILYAQSQQQQQQQQTQQSAANQQAIYAEMLLGPAAANAATANVMQTSLTNNNPGGNPATNVVSTNNNMVGNNTVLISSPSAGAGTATLGNVLSSNSVILPHQQQYNATYSYHAAAAQHLASRPPMAHNPQMAPSPHNAFRSPNFLVPQEVSHFYPGGITFLPGAPPLRTTNAAAAVVNTQPVTPTPQQVQPPQQAQPQPQLQQTPQATILPSPYSSLNVSLSTKPLSCYNCGSQTHIGRECQEASMDDVTRNAIYKLDYSQAATGAGAGATSTPPAQSQQGQQQQQSVSNSASESSISSATQLKGHDSTSNVNSLSSSVASASSVPSATLAAATATAGAK